MLRIGVLNLFHLRLGNKIKKKINFIKKFIAIVRKVQDFIAKNNDENSMKCPDFSVDFAKALQNNFMAIKP